MMKNEEVIASAILRAASLLGNGDASTPMGAIEAHGVQVHEGMTSASTCLSESLDGIAYSLDNIATAIIYLADVIKEKKAA